MSWILNAYAIVFAALLVPAGRWSDRAGRKRGFLYGLALFTLASAASAAAPTLEVLVGARVLQAAGAALMVPTSLGLLIPEFPRRARAAVVVALGRRGRRRGGRRPAAGRRAGRAASWRWVFLINIPIGLVALVPARRILREYRDPERGAVPDVVGAALLMAASA